MFSYKIARGGGKRPHRRHQRCRKKSTKVQEGNKLSQLRTSKKRLYLNRTCENKQIYAEEREELNTAESTLGYEIIKTSTSQGAKD